MNLNELNDCLPSARDILNSSETGLDRLGNRELVLLHENKTPGMSETTELRGRYVSGLAYVDRSRDRVAERVTDFASHDEFVELYDSVTLLEDDGRSSRVRYNIQIEIAVMTLSAEYVLEYRRHDEYEWLWSSPEGDIRTYKGRIELFEVTGGTLLCFTSRLDLSGASWVLDSVLWAQPDLRVTLPATVTAIQLHGFHAELENDPLGSSGPETSSEPSPPVVGGLDLPLETLDDVFDRGTVLLFHPRETVMTSDGPNDLLYTSGIRRLERPADQARRQLCEFENYPDFIDQVDRVTREEDSDRFRTEWFFRLGLGILSVPVEFTIDYYWKNETCLIFESTGGQFDVITGCLEWHELSPDHSLYSITSGSYIGESAGRLVRLANLIPYREIFMGVTLSTVILQKSKHWLENPG